jgi:hypothetical protein
MDEFLEEGKSYTRLYNEYKKFGSLSIGFDFDGTVHDYHKTGQSHEMVRQLLRDLKAIGCKNYCWTAHEDLFYVMEFCKDNKIPCDGINCNALPLPWETRKPFFSVLLDDRAGLIQTYNDLKKLVNTINKENE